jgi:hypothetical protein
MAKPRAVAVVMLATIHLISLALTARMRASSERNSAFNEVFVDEFIDLLID